MERTIGHLRKILAIPSPSRHEEKMEGFLEEFYTELGYAMRKDEWGNMLFYPYDSESLTLFSAHMDTVDIAVDPHVVETDYEIATDGQTALGADDKAAIAVLMTLAEERRNDVAFLFSVAEEIGLFGSGKLDKNFFIGLEIRFCFVLDASGKVGSMITRAPGKTRMTLSFKGRSAHAGFAIEEGINAISLASEFVYRLEKGRFEDGSTLNVGSFVAEGSTNVVPDNAVVTLEIRAVATSRLRAIEEATLKLAKEVDPNVRPTVEHLYEGYELPKDSSIIRHVEASVPDIIKASTMGGSDASHLNRLGIESVVLTSGYLNAHSREERIPKSEIDRLERLIRSLLISRV